MSSIPCLLLLLAIAPSEAGAASLRATVTDQKGKPVEGAVVFIQKAPGVKKRSGNLVHEMQQVDAEFSPSFIAVEAGSKVDFPNKDPFHHHLYSFSQAKSFELPLYKGTDGKPIVFDKPGVVKVGCNIHDWMRGIILVLPTPLFAKTDANGKAKITGIPSKTGVKVAVFHPRIRGSVDRTVRSLSFGKKSSVSKKWSISLKKAKKRKPPNAYR